LALGHKEDAPEFFREGKKGLSRVRREQKKNLQGKDSSRLAGKGGRGKPREEGIP